MEKEFNLNGEILNNLMDDGIPEFSGIRCIPRNKLQLCKNNNYQMERIEQLALSIHEHGLLKSPKVSYKPESDSYVVIDGEYRFRAIDLIIEKFQNFEDKEAIEYKNYLKNVKPFEDSGFPCIIMSYRKIER